LSSANFLAAASIAEAAPNNSFSAITFGSSGFTQSEPEEWQFVYSTTTAKTTTDN
jgi:hypothetical protein